LLIGLLLTWLVVPARLASADDKKPDNQKPVDQIATETNRADPAKPAAKPSPATADASRLGGDAPLDAADPESLRMHLMDGSVITGRLSLKDLSIETKFGMLNVPVAKILSFTPGLASHPTLAKQIAGWIEDLGSGTFNDREAAQQALMKLGPPVRAELERRRDDSDAERRTRVRAILSEFEQAQDDADDSPNDKPNSGAAAYIPDDTVVTTEFTIVGRIVPQSFAISSLYGPLTIKLADVRHIDRDVAKKEELPVNFTVNSSHMVHNGTLNTNIRLERGDTVTVSATGSIAMTPWGAQAMSTPDGGTAGANFGIFASPKAQIPVGALIGKIGNGEDYFKIGSHLTFTAEKTGQFHLAIAMRPEQAGSDFPGQYRVKVHVQRKQ
jgi:hypothetical protein